MIELQNNLLQHFFVLMLTTLHREGKLSKLTYHDSGSFLFSRLEINDLSGLWPKV